MANIASPSPLKLITNTTNRTNDTNEISILFVVFGLFVPFVISPMYLHFSHATHRYTIIWMDNPNINLKLLETPEEIAQVEELQRVVWGGIDAVPSHLLLTAAHNGGLVMGAYDNERLVGFVFGFIGLFQKDKKSSEIKHCSHMLAVLPEYQSRGVGYKLKRAQWQWVRKQGIELITWTYDPLESRNANLNIAKLGAVCNTYHREVYGEMQDGLNAGLPSDRFQVDWWVNSRRVYSRLSRRPRKRLDLAHFISAETQTLNATRLNPEGLPEPLAETVSLPKSRKDQPLLLLVEIPPDFQSLKARDKNLALRWRLHARELFENLFARGYLITDFVHLSGNQSRSYYVLSQGDTTLGG